jgi:hypothetical protein
MVGMTPERITDRDLETLGELEAASRSHAEHGFRRGWCRPMDCGGSNGSHHSKTLAKLVRLGWAISSREPGKSVGGNSRPGIDFKISPAGAERLAQWRTAKRSSKR